MISSLADAWDWYQSVRILTSAIDRLGRNYWADLPWEGKLGRDNRLQNLAEEEIAERSETVLGDLDDLCVLLLFSVFESNLRDRALPDVAVELPPLRDPALLHAVDALNEALEHGSFWKVLEAYKRLDANLVEQVNQVRRYRNWVAHGRRSKQPELVDPKTAHDRLQAFLDLMASEPPGGAIAPLGEA